MPDHPAAPSAAAVPAPPAEPPSRPPPPADWAARVPFFYGWVMVWVTLVILIFSGPGQTWMLGQFTNKFLVEFGLDKSAYNIGYAVATLLAALPMPFIGAWMDRFGLRRATIIAALVVLGAAVVTATARGPYTMFAGIFLFRLGGQGCLAMISGHALAKWFRERLGSVEGIRHAINGGVVSLGPPLTILLINAVGWRPALIIVGCITVAVIVPMMIFLFRETPESIGQKIDNGLTPKSHGSPRRRRAVRTSLKLSEAVRTRAFWVLGLTPCVCVMATTAFILNLQPMMAEVGISEGKAALLVTVFSGINVPLQFIFGWLVDRTPSWFTPVVSNAGLAIAFFLMLGRESWTVAVIANVALAFGHGALWSSHGALLVRFFGLDHQGAIRGMMTNIIVAGSASGPIAVGAFVALTDSYDSALIFFAVSAVVVCVLAATIRDPSRAQTADPDGTDHVLSPKEQARADAEAAKTRMATEDEEH